MKYYDLRNKDDREELRQELRRRVSCLDYLEKARHGGYCCPLCGSGTHENGTGAVKYYPETRKWACHACKINGAAKYSGDVIDLYMHKYGTDHNTALFLMAQEQGIPIDSYTDEATSARIEDGYRRHKEERATAPLDGPNNPERPEGEEIPAGDSNEAETAPQAATGTATETTQAPAADYTAYYERCRARLKAPEAVEYITGRGVSIETAERCGVGYDPTADPASAPGALEDTGKRHPCPRLIFPTTPAHYVGRSINPDTPKGYRKMNPARERGAGSPGLFNTGALYSGKPVVFVFEGAFDALSVEEVGGAAVALNSASNGAILLSALKERPTKAALVLCPDNDADDTTRARTHQQFEELAEELRKAGYKCFVAKRLSGAHKDANEALQADRGAFTAAVQGVTTYMVTPDNVTLYIDHFMRDDIEKFRSECKTGFSILDRKTGGLYPGLYVVGAISSLGKTTFVHQMADQIAAAGKDVLYFSLEQSRLELVSKSFARLTAKESLINFVSSMKIRSGAAPENVKRAATAYRDGAARHMNIIEGTGERKISAEYVREYTQNYIANTGRRPVVVIDYLQILAPMEADRGRSTKEVVDNSISELARIKSRLGVTIIAISSINRTNYTTPIDFESFKESGGIEYGADVVMGLQLECIHEPLFSSSKSSIVEKRDRVNEAKAATPRKIELVLLKNRYGRIDITGNFDYYPAADLFVERSEEPRHYPAPEQISARF